MNNKILLAERTALRSIEPISLSLIIIDFVLFASGAIAHWVIPITLGFATWNETFLVPAAIVEGVGALALGTALITLGAGMTWSRRLALWALWYCFAGISAACITKRLIGLER